MKKISSLFTLVTCVVLMNINVMASDAPTQEVVSSTLVDYRVIFGILFQLVNTLLLVFILFIIIKFMYTIYKYCKNHMND